MDGLIKNICEREEILRAIAKKKIMLNIRVHINIIMGKVVEKASEYVNQANLNSSYTQYHLKNQLLVRITILEEIKQYFTALQNRNNDPLTKAKNFWTKVILCDDRKIINFIVEITILFEENKRRF